MRKIYANKVDNLEKINTFLETYNFPRLSQEDTENLNQSITTNNIKSVTKRLPKKPPKPVRFGNSKANLKRGGMCP